MRFPAIVLAAMAVVSSACVPLAEAATVTGRVLATDGKPVAGASVWAWRSVAFEAPAGAVAKTDAEGRFSLPYEPVTRDEGRVTVGAVAEGFGAGARLVTSATAPLDVPLRPQCALTVRLLHAAAGDAPVAGVVVKARRAVVTDRAAAISLEVIDGPADASVFTARTDKDGVAVIRGLPQNARAFLDVDDDRFARLTYPSTILLPGEAAFTAPPTVLQPAVTVRGRVTYDKTGEPAVGVRVALQGAGAHHGWGDAVTGADGRYRVTRMPAGTYVASLHLGTDLAKEWTARAVDGLVLVPGVEATDTNFTLVTGSLVTGHVRDDAGRGIADVPIGLHGPARPRSAGAIQRAVSAADGSYSMRTPAGEQYVYVQVGSPPKGYQLPPEDERHRTVTTADDRHATVDFTFARATADSVVKGLVVDGDGKPVSGASVVVESDRQQFAAAATSDAEGRFELAREPGDESFRMRARKGDLATPAAVAPARDGSATLQLRAGALAGATGKVVDAAGKPVPGATVSLTEMTGQFGLGREVAVVGADGAFALSELWADGRYHVSATAKGFGHQQRPLKLSGGKILLLAPLVIKPLDSFVAGTVVAADGEPMADADVSAHGSESGSASVRTDAAGRFRIPTVADDTIRLFAQVRSEQPSRLGEANVKSGSDDVTIILEERGKR